jgi:hypothetical protein
MLVVLESSKEDAKIHKNRKVWDIANSCSKEEQTRC